MNMTLTYKSALFILVLGIAILLFLQFKSCQPRVSVPSYSQSYVDSLNDENNSLVDEICDLHGDISALDSVLLFRKDKVIKGRETIKYLEKTVTITDTIVITYVDALNNQIKELDTIVDIQDKKIDKQAKIIDKQDTIIVNTNKIVAIQEKELEDIQKVVQIKDKKIKILKFERWLYPIIGIAATVLILK
jgi:hypothetical protein